MARLTVLVSPPGTLRTPLPSVFCHHIRARHFFWTIELGLFWVTEDFTMLVFNLVSFAFFGGMLKLWQWQSVLNLFSFLLFSIGVFVGN